MAAANSHGSHSLLEGLQIRLSDKYRPAKRIVLGSEFVQRSQEDMEGILDLDYDFRVEQQVLASYEQQRAGGVWSAMLREAESDAAGPDKRPPAGPAGRPAAASPVPTGHVKPARPPPPHSGAGEAGVRLNPAGASATFQQPLQPQKVSPQLARPDAAAQGHSFRVEDFEPNAANPFDNEELKSLNDMEELGRLLQH